MPRDVGVVVVVCCKCCRRWKKAADVGRMRKSATGFRTAVVVVFVLMEESDERGIDGLGIRW